MRSRVPSLKSALPAALLLILTTCMVNPATGRREISLVSEGREIEMGREYDPQIVSQMGTYDDEELEAYVSEIGLRMAAESERPDLPWTFRVVDEPIVNAFAVPGGFIYITRGIMAHLNSEAELAGVIGHEIGHVTARHSANQLTRIQLQAIAVGVGSLLSERVAEWGDFLGAGLGIINLSYGRGDESESDMLGVRYMGRTGYNPEAMAQVFRTLALVSGGGTDRTPEFLSTHPYPENREERILEMTAELPPEQLAAGRIRADAYLTRLQGLTYGPDPRQGYFEDGVFYHPDMAFQLRFPDGWTAVNQRSQVMAVSPGEDAAVILELASGDDPDAALLAFLAQDGVQPGRSRSLRINGLDAAAADFDIMSKDAALEGNVVFVKLGEQVFQIMGIGTTAGWDLHSEAVDRALNSFDQVTDRSVLSKQPDRIEIIRLPSEMTLEQFYARYPTPLELDEVARMNRREAGELIPAGTLLKHVRGG